MSRPPLIASPLVTRLAVALATMCAAACNGSSTPPTSPPPSTVTSVIVSPSTISLVAGGATATLTATVMGSSGPISSPSVAWSSSAAVATVSGSGSSVTVTGIAPGTAIITATSGGKSGSATVTVSAAPAALPTVTLAATDPNASEVGPDPGVVTVTRTGPTTATLRVNVTIAGTATSGTDFVAPPPFVDIPVGQASVTIQVTPIADAIQEGSETVTLTLATGAYDIGSSNAATITIADAPVTTPTVTVIASDANASEVGPDVGTFTITRTGATTAGLAVSLGLAGTATNGVDYTTIASVATIPVGQSSVIVTVTPIVDATVEGAETVVLTLSAGSYTIGTSASAQVNIADAPPPTAGGTLQNHQNQTGRIAAAGQIDTWTFAANQGDYIALSLTQLTGSTSSGFTPTLRLLSPTGTVLGTQGRAFVSEINVTAPATGTYTVTVADGDAKENGDYIIRLARAPVAFTVASGDDGGAITNGTNHTGVITIGDIDMWTFTAAQGDYIALRLALDPATAKDSFEPWIRLIGPTGAVIGTSVRASVAEIDIAAPAAGTYTVLVAAAGDNGFGGNNGTSDYTLRLAQTPSTFTVPSGDDGGAMTNGANHTGTITLGDMDTWTFTATQGDYIALRMASDPSTVKGGFEPWIRLIGPTGSVIATSVRASVAEVDMPAPATGTYTVLVASAGDNGFNGNAGTSNYTLRLAQTPSTFTVPAGDEGGPMTNGANHTGVITVGDMDSWTFTASQGEYIALRLASDPQTATASFEPWIRLIGPTGAVVGMSARTTVAEVGMAAPATGTYTVLVASAGDNGFNGNIGTSNYTVRLAKSPGAFTVPSSDEGGALGNGASHTGTITLGDIDMWSFSTAGGAISVTMAKVTTTTVGFEPWIRLIGPTGTLVATVANVTAAQITVNAPAAGTYTVLAATGGDNGFSGNIGTGTYTIVVNGVGVSAAGPARPAVALPAGKKPGMSKP